MDVRGCYCALAACHMLCLDKQAVAEACDMVGYIRRCQVRTSPCSCSSAAARVVAGAPRAGREGRVPVASLAGIHQASLRLRVQ